jgi:hypothetical protein
MGDEYYDEPQAVPSFSDGSYSNKGAKSSALASRVSASKNANAVASRASAIMMASMQQLKNTKYPIVNSHQSAPSVNNANKQAINIAEKRAQHMLQGIRINQVNNNIHNTHTIPVLLPQEAHDLITPPWQLDTEKVKVEEIVSIYNSDIHRDIVSNTFIKKKLLLETYEPISPKVFKKTRNVTLVKCSSPPIGDIDPSLISTLSTNLLNILNTGSDKNEILNEFNRYSSSARISHEEPIHKYSVEKARIIKNTYFTSDT